MNNQNDSDQNQDSKNQDQDPKKQNQGDESVTDTKKTDNSEPNGLNLSDEDFEKVFEDERLFKHPRFNKLRERAQTAESELQKKQQAEEERKLKRLEKKGKTKELLETYKQKAEDAENRYKQELLNRQIQAEATKQGAVDLEAVLKLIDRDTVQFDDDGNVSGVEEAVKGLLESKSYLKGGTQTQDIGSGTNPSGDGGSTGVKTFTRSQIEDGKFYRENEKDILEAMKSGRIIEDATV